MVANDNAPNLTPHGALWHIASKEEVIRGLLQDPPKVFIKTTSI